MNTIWEHIKTGKRYEVISNKFMCKDIIHKESGSNGGLSYWEKTTYEWRKGLVLYKALYDNPDGPYFARCMEDFMKNFRQVEE